MYNVCPYIFILIQWQVPKNNGICSILSSNLTQVSLLASEAQNMGHRLVVSKFVFLVKTKTGYFLVGGWNWLVWDLTVVSHSPNFLEGQINILVWGWGCGTLEQVSSFWFGWLGLEQKLSPINDFYLTFIYTFYLTLRSRSYLWGFQLM
jgi:hypothetical protein